MKLRLGQSDTLFKWREPWLIRLRLHSDFVPWLLLSLLFVVTAGSIGFLMGLIDKGWYYAAVGAVIGAFVVGGMVSLAVFFRPDGFQSRVTVDDQSIRRKRDTFGFGQGEHIRERWPFEGLVCIVVPAELLDKSFSVLVLPHASRKRAAYLGFPTHVDMTSLASYLTASGVHIETATPEFAESVKADRPYRSGLVKTLIGLCIAICLGIAVAIVAAGDRIAGN